MKPDFSGYATRANVRCSDGRTIQKDAFVHNDGEKVPLVWQHSHDTPENMLGHAVLENREDGVYAYGYFNDSPRALSAKESVRHGDITKLSIYANKLVERNQVVHAGHIREVSLVLAGANPGAIIENVQLRHSDGDVEILSDSAVIQSDAFIMHSDGDADDNSSDSDNSDDDRTLEDVLDSMTDEQRSATLFLIEQAENKNGASSSDSDDGEMAQSLQDINPLIHKELSDMTRNLFEQFANNGAPADENISLSHDDMGAIFADAKRKGSFKHALNDYALEHGISNVEMLFPDFKTPDGIQKYDRNVEWVEKVLSGIRRIPMTRVRTLVADMTTEEARAKGYITGNLKKEQVIALLKRTTEPTTIYKKQAIDRDDLLDVTDFDIVSFFHVEMRAKVKELLAEVILVGDGRSAADEDHVPTDKIRPIAYDNDFYSVKETLPSNVRPEDVIKQIIRSRSKYRGTGTPTMFTSIGFATDLLLVEDGIGNRKYKNMSELADTLRVKEIVEVEHFENHPTIHAILVNLNDYSLGTDKGGELTTFEDFDIDYNKHKWLIETRVSGALNKPRSAIVIAREEGEEVIPNSPSFNSETNTILIPSTAGVEYHIDGETVTGSVEILSETQVDASAKAGYYIPVNTNTSWTFVPADA